MYEGGGKLAAKDEPLGMKVAIGGGSVAGGAITGSNSTPIMISPATVEFRSGDGLGGSARKKGLGAVAVAAGDPSVRVAGGAWTLCVSTSIEAVVMESENGKDDGVNALGVGTRIACGRAGEETTAGTSCNSEVGGGVYAARNCSREVACMSESTVMGTLESKGSTLVTLKAERYSGDDSRHGGDLRLDEPSRHAHGESESKGEAILGSRLRRRRDLSARINGPVVDGESQKKAAKG